VRKFGVPVAAWAVLLVASVLLAGELIEAPTWVRWGVLGPLALAILVASRFSNRAGRFPLLDRLAGQNTTVAAVCVFVAVAGGGSGEPAALALLLPLLLMLKASGARRAAFAAPGLFLILILLDTFVIGRAVDVANASAALATLFVILLLSAGAARASSSGTAGASMVAGAPRAVPEDRIEAAVGRNGTVRQRHVAMVGEQDRNETGANTEAAWDDRSAAAPAPDPAARILLAAYLRQVRQYFGADEAVLWLPATDSGQLIAGASSSRDESAAALGDIQQLSSILRWSSESQVVQCGALDGGDSFLVAPVALSGRAAGVMSLRGKRHFDDASGAARARVASHTAFLSQLLILSDNYSSALSRSEALELALGAVRGLQERSLREPPASAICDAILNVAHCDASAVVRWSSEDCTGVLAAGSGEFEPIEGRNVAPSSIVGATCQRATPMTIAAAEEVLARVPLFDNEDGVRRLGAFVVHPMRSGGDVIGALVAAWRTPAGNVSAAATGVEVLASVAAHAMQTAWKLEEVQLAARTDALTGLRNRGFLDEQLVRVLAESRRFGDPASLILLDLDFFKSINDSYGHAAGDMVLCQVAAALRETVRGVDMCARYGGEELAVLLPRTGIDGALELAERLRAAVESRPLHHNGNELRITASFGVASYPDPAGSPAALLAQADRALYRAKQGGRNRVSTIAVNLYEA
jgi:diguanylate cyclase (GGDEF)-like protein